MIDVNPQTLIGLDPISTTFLSSEILFEGERLFTLGIVTQDEFEYLQSVIDGMIRNNRY